VKTFKCSDLGGPCDTEFSGNDPDELLTNGTNHVMEMATKGDEPHLKLKQQMDAMMGTDEEKTWREDFMKMWEAK